MDATDFTIQHRWFVVLGLGRPLRTMMKASKHLLSKAQYA